ncbi:MAG TPA: DUF1801 domain-containing protein [Chitinophagaceae bacterium]|jgi:uncharacterized protein YdhG (YjbR/CyaY superfamily)
MKAAHIKFKTVDEYISAFPAGTKKILQEVRKTIKAAAPQAEDVISYNMPASRLNGILVYYAAYEKHIGFYPTASGIKIFQDQLADYKFSKGAIQFPIDKPMPFDLITKIVKFRVKEMQEKEKKRLT